MNEILSALNNLEIELNPKRKFSDSELHKFDRAFGIVKTNLTTVESGLDVPLAIELGKIDLGSTNNGNLPSIPLLIPFKEGRNIIFEIDNSINSFVNQQIQIFTVSICQSLKPDICKITVLDFKRDDFPYLDKLGVPYVKAINKRDDLRKAIDVALNTASRIKSDYLTSGYKNLSDYNTNPNTKYPEPFNIFICSNLFEDFSPDEIRDIISLSKKRDAGFYFIFTANPNSKNIKSNSSHLEELYSELCETCEVIKFNREGKSVINASVLPNLKYFTPTEFIPIDLSSQIDSLRDSIRAYDSTTNFISLPIGSKGGKPFNFDLGDKAQAHSVLIGGRARSGKTSLLNNIISQIGEKYTTDEVRLFLLDYKEGVEFSVYEDHPNVEMLLLDNSKIEFGINVLKKMQSQISERARLFTEIGVRNIDSYNVKSEEKLPRIITIIDEFQKMFESREGKSVVTSLLADVARRGQGFGLHLILCTQSLQDYSLDQQILNQIALRIVLQIDRTECSKFLAPGNEAPAHLTAGISGQRQGVYNSGGGIEKFNQIINLDYVPDEEVKNRVLSAKLNNTLKPIEKQIIKPNGNSEGVIENQPTEKPQTTPSNNTWASFSNRYNKEK